MTRSDPSLHDRVFFPPELEIADNTVERASVPEDDNDSAPAIFPSALFVDESAVSSEAPVRAVCLDETGASADPADPADPDNASAAESCFTGCTVFTLFSAGILSNALSSNCCCIRC